MELVYKATHLPVEIGDICALRDDIKVEVVGVQFPHKPSSTGRVFVMPIAEPHEEHGYRTGTLSYFPGVIGAEWINREDQD